MARELAKHHPDVDEDSFYTYLSELFGKKNRERPPLRKSLEIALYRTISEYTRKNKGKYDENWRMAVKGNIQMLSQLRYAGREDSEEAIFDSLSWADAVTVVTCKLDPLVQGWPSHPLDTIVYDLLSIEDRKDEGKVAPRGRPNLVLVAKKDEDSRDWLYRMMVPFVLHKHGDFLFEQRPPSDGEIGRLASQFLMPVSKAFEEGRHFVRMHTLPGSACYMPFFMTEHGWVRQAYLNLPPTNSPRTIAVPCDTIVDDIGLPLSLSASSRVQLKPIVFNREASNFFIRYVRDCRAGDKQALEAKSKGERFVPFDPLGPEDDPPSDRESAAPKSAAQDN